MREGLHETLTVVRLSLTGALHLTLRLTNAIENLNGSVERCTRNVKRWRGGEMIQRWVSAALLDAERRFRRVRGFRDMPRLMLALDDPSARYTGDSRVEPITQEIATGKFNNAWDNPKFSVYSQWNGQVRAIIDERSLVVRTDAKWFFLRASYSF